MKHLLTINGQEHVLEIENDSSQPSRLVCSLDGERFEADVAALGEAIFSILLGGRSFQARVAAGGSAQNGNPSGRSSYRVQIDGTSYAIALQDARRGRRAGSTLGTEGSRNVTAPMPGKIIRVLVAENDMVEAGQGLIVVEAMKMQNEIKSPKKGLIQAVRAREGQTVNSGETLIVVG
jgi:biotin carboxyl carrier protein